MTEPRGFEVGATRSGVAGGVRLPVRSFIGPTLWAAFHVDLVGSEIRMTGESEPVPPLARVLIPDVEQHGYCAYPLVEPGRGHAIVKPVHHGAEW